MPADLRLLEDRLAVARHLEASAAGWLQRNGRRRKLLLQLGRQTDGPWLVASNGAVLDFDIHDLGMPAMLASLVMIESCFAMTTLSESICSCMTIMS